MVFFQFLPKAPAVQHKVQTHWTKIPSLCRFTQLHKKVWQGKYLSVALSGNEQCCKDFLRATRKIVIVKNAKIVCPLLHHCTRTTKRLSHDETCISSMPSTNGLCFKSLYNVVDNIVVRLCRRTSESLYVSSFRIKFALINTLTQLLDDRKKKSLFCQFLFHYYSIKHPLSAAAAAAAVK